MPRCLECEKNKTIEETKNNAAETAELMFKPFALEDKALIDSYTKPWNLQCSDLSFANLFIWGADGKMEYAEKNNVLYIKLEFKGVPVFLWAPIPKYGVEVDYRKAVYEGIDYMKKRGVEPTYRSVWTMFKDKMLTACPELFSMPTDIAWDYVYTRESLATLKGKKLHGKRNHINKFKSTFDDWCYEPITKENVEECFQMALRWRNESGCEEDVEKNAEMCVTLNSLRLFEELELTGGVLRVDGEVVAFTIGEPICEDTFVVHFEKAFADIEGAYTMINQQFVEHECRDYLYVNREEDTGSEGLRKAKLSYRPVFMVEKGTVTEKEI